MTPRKARGEAKPPGVGGLFPFFFWGGGNFSGDLDGFLVFFVFLIGISMHCLWFS